MKISNNVDRIVAGVAQSFRYAVRKTFVDEELHALSRSGSSRSSTAAAAYRSESWMSAGVSCGKSATISSTVMDSAIMPTTVATGMRVP